MRFVINAKLVKRGIPMRSSRPRVLRAQQVEAANEHEIAVLRTLSFAVLERLSRVGRALQEENMRDLISRGFKCKD